MPQKFVTLTDSGAHPLVIDANKVLSVSYFNSGFSTLLLLTGTAPQSYSVTGTPAAVLALLVA